MKRTVFVALVVTAAMIPSSIACQYLWSVYKEKEREEYERRAKVERFLDRRRIRSELELMRVDEVIHNMKVQREKNRLKAEAAWRQLQAVHEAGKKNSPPATRTDRLPSEGPD